MSVDDLIKLLTGGKFMSEGMVEKWKKPKRLKDGMSSERLMPRHTRVAA